MPTLITVQEVKDYGLNQRTPGSVPSSLTDAIITVYITAATADILQWAGLTEVPAAGLRLDSLKERCRELVAARIDAAFFGVKRDVAESVEARVRAVLEAVEETQGQARSSITPTRRYKRYTDEHDLVELDP